MTTTNQSSMKVDTGTSADSHHVQYNNTFRNFCDRLKLADSGSFPVIFGE
jgi:hypothetical protein